jgi:hypothetical protein
MKWIVTQPIGGLGNRLRVLASALVLAEIMDRRVLLVWIRNPCCKGDYADLFEPTPLFDVASPGTTRWMAHLMRAIPVPAMLLPVASGFGRNVATIDGARLVDLRFRVQPSELDAHPVIHLAGIHWDFMPAGMPADAYAEAVSRVLKQLRPSAPIARRLFDIPSPKVGVHIRHGEDSPDAVRISSLERFVQKMESCLAEAPATKFFLATDRPDIEAGLRDRFGDRILSSPKASHGRDRTGLHDALVDLFMLSRCDRILGSYWSSFSEYAALLGGVEMEVIGVGPWAGPGQAILTRAEKYEKYGSEGWKQGWSPEGPPPGWTPDGPPVRAA